MVLARAGEVHDELATDFIRVWAGSILTEFLKTTGPSEKEHEATIAGLRGLCLYKLRTYGDTAGEC